MYQAKFNPYDESSFNPTPSNYTCDPKISTKKIEPEKSMDTMCRTRCVVVDSRDRNTSVFPNSNNFEVLMNPSGNFGGSLGYSGASLFREFKNILEIKLVECILPKIVQTNVSYLILQIPEIDDNLSGTTDDLRKSFTVLLPDKVQNNFVQCRTSNMCYCNKKFIPPLANLNKMTFKFLQHDGTLFDFTDTGNNTGDNDEVMMIFEITTIEKNRFIIPSNIITPSH